MNLAVTTVFDVTMRPNSFFESGRILLFLVGFVIFAAALVRVLHHEIRWSGGLCIAVGLLTCVQEVSVIGQPVYPWRIALLAVINICAGMYLYRPERDRGGAASHVPR